jgi:hypothetical protein
VQYRVPPVHRLNQCPAVASCAARANGDSGVQAQDEGAEFGVVADGGGDVVDLGKPVVAEGPPCGGESAGFVDFDGWVVGAFDEAVIFGVLVQAAECGDEVFGGAVSAAGVTPLHDIGFHLGGKGFDLGGCRFVDVAVGPFGKDAVPSRSRRPGGCRR